MAASDQQKREAAPPESNAYLWIALLCGAVPLTIGSLVYWTWRYTRWESLPLLGLWTVFIGIPAFVVGMICLFRYRSVALRHDAAIYERLSLKTAIVATLLLVNFPAAAFYAVSAVDHMGDTLVSVANESPNTIESFILTGPGAEVELGPVRSGKTAQVYMVFRGDGQLEFRARVGTQEIDGTVSEYVTGNWGGSYAVRIKGSGHFEVEEVSSPMGLD